MHLKGGLNEREIPITTRERRENGHYANTVYLKLQAAGTNSKPSLLFSSNCIKHTCHAGKQSIAVKKILMARTSVPPSLIPGIFILFVE